MKKKILIATLAVATLLLPMGCKRASVASQATPVLQGACNSYDSGMYRALIGFQASLLSLHAMLVSPNTAPGTISALQPYVTRAIKDYNLAEGAWQAYHAACISQPSLSPATAQAAINKVQTDLQQTVGVK